VGGGLLDVVQLGAVHGSAAVKHQGQVERRPADLGFADRRLDADFQHALGGDIPGDEVLVRTQVKC
jgi:hypothetical protein